MRDVRGHKENKGNPTLQLQLYPSLSGDTLQLLEQWLPPGSSLETDIATHKTDINTHRHYRGETQERHSETLGN